ncbi:orotidine-5'-phosphate decarboxylase [Blastopirellula retiformator]|uniref:Orotidine 5'-phosphate decarboxylase n=1 Tax=Blastopirellula retiformator TaxID=2527970 RepID=A0A5C5USB6_9BACT|nr:orotidine-5'-phosphate decarboxylase [Blastopirellula retiformator]TWT29264.1 Orotidine 5'-phosphate decarboxylase [Blastopirellula retiformator]
MASFAERLAAAVRQKGTPALVGIDPRFEQLPPALQTDSSPSGQATAFAKFSCELIDAVADQVAVVKPQAAFYEQLGPFGMAALGKTVSYARERGLLVILDCKRGDIGSTAEAYAKAYLGDESAWGADCLTVSPYLGDDSLTPFVDQCTATDSGIFVLVKTSNPGSGTLQDLSIDGKTIYRRMAEHVESLAAATKATGQQYGAVGAVVGATYPAQLSELREVMPSAWLLVPGFGSQGGGPKDVAASFDADGLGALINNSRGINFAFAKEPYKTTFGPARWQEASAAATSDMIAALKADTPAGKL